MENIIVSSFKRNDNYDYEVDIKASDFEPAAASECGYLNYSINALKPISYGLLHYNPPPQSGGGNEQIRGLTKSSIIDDPGNDNSSGSYEYISTRISDDDVGKAFVIFLDGIKPSQNMLYGTIEKNNDGKLYLKARTHDYYDQTRQIRVQINFPTNNDYIIDGVKHYSSTNTWDPSQKGNITLTIKAPTCEVTVVNSENTIYLLGNVNSNVQYQNSVFEVTSYKTDRTIKLLEDMSLKLYGKVNNNNGKFSTKVKKIGYSENDYMIQILSFYDETNNRTIPLNLLSGTLKLKSTKIIPPFVDKYAYVEIDVNFNDGTIYLKNKITKSAYDSENGYYPIFALDIFNTQLVLRLRNNYNENNVPASHSWWGDVGLDTGAIIKRGTILKVTNRVIDQTRSATHYGKLVYDSTYPFLPAYIIAKENYTITGNGYNDYLNIGLPVDWGDEDAPYGKIDTQIKISDSNIWESCAPSDPYARSKPWSFVTEGIVTDYISFQWNDKYNEPGTFTLALVATQENMDLFKEDRYIMISSSDRVMMIENVEFNVNLKADGYIMTVSGRSLEAILERRAIFPGQGLSTNEYKGPDGLCKALYDLVDGFFMNPEKVASISSDGQKAFYYPERRVPFLKLPDDRDSLIKRVFHQSINLTVSKDDVLKIVQEQCKQTDLGFKIIPKKRYGSSKCIEWEFCLYTGKDKSYGRSDTSNPLMVFSPTIGNVEAISTVKDSKNYRNVIFCGVEKESDGYIDLTKDVNDANYWGQKTGVEIVDSINSNATNLISGVKNSLVTKLEASPVCYTGILFLALAAMRNDCDYQPTVNMITRNDPHSKMYVIKFGEYPVRFGTTLVEMEKRERDVGKDNPFYMVAYTGYHDDDGIIYDNKIFIQSCLIFDGEYNIYIKPNGENIDKLYFDWCFNHPITCRVEYFYINGEPYGKLIPEGLGNSIIAPGNDHDINNIRSFMIETHPNTRYARHIPIYSYQDDSIENEYSKNVAGWMRIQLIKEDNEVEYVKAYPSKYIEKTEAQNIYITYRQAYGDNETIYSGNKTDQFRLCAVNSACAVNGERDFKTSTGFGWLTTPILKQAITDLNNTKFSGLSVLKKSAIQAWFKTLDKYTGSKNQIRWLCQEHVQNSSMIGLDRREVFVEEDNSDNTDWNASKINQWQQNTKEIAADQNEDEETDEQINERLLKTARKKSGEYRRTRDIDASLDLTEYNYDSSGESTSPGTYTLGDIIQIDDGYGNLEKYLISGVTQSMDTTSGPKIVPSFEKYELIPKQYHRLEWIRVANMMLPAKFNPMYEVVSSSNELSLPSNVYFGAMAKDRDQSIERQQDLELGSITAITYERLMKISDIEMNASYKQNIPASGETSPLADSFAMISAIGSYRELESGVYDMNIPLAVLFSKKSSPLLFMSKYNDNNDNYRAYTYISNGVTNRFGNYIYRVGCGYKNLYVKGNENSIDTLDEFKKYIIYSDEVINSQEDHYFYINKLESYNARYSEYNEGTTEYFLKEIDNKLMYYSKSKIDNIENSYRPLSRLHYNGIVGNKAYMLDESCGLYTKEPNNSNYKFDKSLNSVTTSGEKQLRPCYYMNGDTKNYSNVLITTYSSFWGQDNYIWTSWHDDKYQRYELENNFVLGGCGYQTYDREKNQYHLHFDGQDDDTCDVSPRSCDTRNGVTLYNLKIYETEATLRSIKFDNIDSSKIISDTINHGEDYYFDGEYSFDYEGDNFTRTTSNNRIRIQIKNREIYYSGLSDESITAPVKRVRFDWTQTDLGYPLTCSVYNRDGLIMPLYFYISEGTYIVNNVSIYDSNQQTFTINIEIHNSDWNSPLRVFGENYFDAEIPAYYPDLNTRVLAHEYVPVVYVDAEEDTPVEEKYGLYDITEQTFVPVKFGSNSAGTFIAAGGEIIDQE